jgi:hypothetical protein
LKLAKNTSDLKPFETTLALNVPKLLSSLPMFRPLTYFLERAPAKI